MTIKRDRGREAPCSRLATLHRGPIPTNVQLAIAAKKVLRGENIHLHTICIDGKASSKAPISAFNLKNLTRRINHSHYLHSCRSVWLYQESKELLGLAIPVLNHSRCKDGVKDMSSLSKLFKEVFPYSLREKEGTQSESI